MGAIAKIQPSFASGELTPYLYSRVDLNRYQTGLKTLKNFFVHPHGGASNRPGTKFVAEAKDSDTASRIVKFIFSKTQAYVIEFGDYYVRFFKNHAQIAKSSVIEWVTGTVYVVGDYRWEDSTGEEVTYRCVTAHTSGTFATDLAAVKWVAQEEYEVTTPYAAADLADLRFERSGDVLYIFHNDYLSQTLSRYADDDWRLADYEPDDGPFMPENVNTSVMLACSATGGTAAITITSTSAVFATGHVDALFKLNHYIPAQAVTTAFTGTASSSSVSCFTTWRIISHGTWTGKIRIEKSSNGGSTWTALRDFSSADDFNVNTFGTEDIETNPAPFLIRCTCYAYTSGTCNVDLTSDPFYHSGIARIVTVTNSTAATATVLTSFGSTAATASWAEGAFSTYRGFPGLGAFNQDRLCLAATTAEPMNIWMSQTANYESHRVNSTTLATDAINIKLLARQLNAVNSLVALGDLISLTSATEWRIGADKTTLSSDTVFSKIQGYRGSNGIAPVIVGSQIIYVQSNGSVVRNFGYDYSIDSYAGVDLRILSEQLFTRYNIIDMEYQQDPDSLVWCVRDDGKLLSMTYMQEQDVIAWSWHETDGLVESITVIPKDGYDELWLLVNRDGTRFIEYMVQRMDSTDVQDQYFVDCGITYDSPIDITGATNANPIVITAVAHGFNDDDLVDISDMLGMTELNGKRFKVANSTTDTFELYAEDAATPTYLTDELGNKLTTEGGDFLISETLEETSIDGESYGVYTSGGYVRKVYSTFSGLDHLEGLTVAILGNGEVYPQQVVEDGEITLTHGCSRVHIGLPYTSDFETLNVELGLRSGTSQGKPMKISNVTFRLINSRGGWIGPNADELHEGFIPNRVGFGIAPLLFSGDVREPLGAGFEDGGRVFLRQIDPLPITITAIIPEVTVYK